MAGYLLNVQAQEFPGGPVVKKLPCNPGDTGSVPGRGTKILHTAGPTKPASHSERFHMMQ